MLSKQPQNHYYPNFFESIVIVFIFIFLSLTIGTLMVSGLGTHGTITQDLIALFGYILTAGGTLLITLQFKKAQNPEEKTFQVNPYSYRTGIIVILLSFLVIMAIDPINDLIPVSDYFREVINKMFSPTIPALLTAVVAAPVLEELIFRGIMLEGLLKNYNPIKAIIITNLLFGIAHLNPWQFAGAFLTGLFISWVYWRTRSIKLAIIIHFINNAISYTAILITSKSPADISIKTFINNDLIYYSAVFISLIIIVTIVFYENKLKIWKK
ncbi:MAG: CPBP family intramembrane glutamic endopeptidase [Bacteroidales bacterium]